MCVTGFEIFINKMKKKGTPINGLEITHGAELMVEDFGGTMKIKIVSTKPTIKQILPNLKMQWNEPKHSRTILAFDYAKLNTGIFIKSISHIEDEIPKTLWSEILTNMLGTIYVNQSSVDKLGKGNFTYVTYRDIRIYTNNRISIAYGSYYNNKIIFKEFLNVGNRMITKSRTYTQQRLNRQENSLMNHLYWGTEWVR